MSHGSGPSGILTVKCGITGYFSSLPIHTFSVGSFHPGEHRTRTMLLKVPASRNLGLIFKKKKKSYPLLFFVLFILALLGIEPSARQALYHNPGPQF